MDEEIYRHINNLWWTSLVIGMWAVVAFVLNHLKVFNDVRAWNELYPVCFPFAIVLFLFGFIFSSNYKICVWRGWIKLTKNPTNR
jgi:hypothetical protein